MSGSLGASGITPHRRFSSRRPADDSVISGAPDESTPARPTTPTAPVTRGRGGAFTLVIGRRDHGGSRAGHRRASPHDRAGRPLCRHDAERLDRRDVDRRVVPGNATRSQCCVRRLGHEVCCEFVAVRCLHRSEQHGIEAAGRVWIDRRPTRLREGQLWRAPTRSMDPDEVVSGRCRTDPVSGWRRWWFSVCDAESKVEVERRPHERSPASAIGGGTERLVRSGHLRRRRASRLDASPNRSSPPRSPHPASTSARYPCLPADDR